MKKDFKDLLSKKFPIIKALPLKHSDGTKTIGLVLESKDTAEELNILLKNEPYSFSIQKLVSGQNQFSIRFTNSEFDHIIKIENPIELFIDKLNPFYIQIISIDESTKELSKIGNPHLQIFENLN